MIKRKIPRPAIVFFRDKQTPKPKPCQLIGRVFYSLNCLSFQMDAEPVR